MDDVLPSRIPHPIQDSRRAFENQHRVCSVRGYCGPFINEDFYNAFPDPMWHGYGECLVCCSTVLVAQEEAKRRATGDSKPAPAANG